MTIQKIKIEFDTTNDNFFVDMQDEIKQVLKRASDAISGKEYTQETAKTVLRDTNGNTIGSLVVESDIVKSFDDTEYTGDPNFNWDDQDGQEGQMETYSPHYEEVQAQLEKHPKTVWTVIDGEDGRCWIVAGFHYVNRFMYFVSNEEWECSNERYLWG